MACSVIFRNALPNGCSEAGLKGRVLPWNARRDLPKLNSTSNPICLRSVLITGILSSWDVNFCACTRHQRKFRGHGPGQQVLQYGKERVNIWAIEPVGNYAVVLKFDDGHDTGIYSWDLLYELGINQEKYWQSYLDRLKEAGYQRKETAP